MGFDLATSLSVLGVVLTIAFFVVGYRQTIGARKERARAANKAIMDLLFRRLTLEEEFSLDSAEIEKLLHGWILEARVRYSDIWGAEDLEAMLIARVIENDYISPSHRYKIKERIKEIFARPLEESLANDAGEMKRGLSAEIAFLGLGSAAAAIAGLIPTLLASSENFISSDRAGVLGSSLLPAVITIALTTMAISAYFLTRDRTKLAPSEVTGGEAQASSFERAFLNVVRAYIPNLVRADGHGLDFMFDSRHQKFGIELKQDLQSLGKARLRRLLSALDDKARELSLSKIYLVVRNLRSDFQIETPASVRIMTPADFIMQVAYKSRSEKKENIAESGRQGST